jgi:DNA-binding NarL/FixJ family response regulator
MPVCSGPQTMEMIRSENTSSAIPIIFLTSKDDKESVMKVLELKPDGYLLKNMRPEDIVKAIDQHFNSKNKNKL